MRSLATGVAVEAVGTDAKGTRILARTFFQQLRQSGLTANQIIGVATELIDLVTEDLKVNSAAVRAAQVEVPTGATPTPMPPAHVRARPQ